ncbi:MAG: flagellar motor protein MotB [Hyphomicrobium sp.]|nr:MAG: flagellar motor protein MotB [Hyphomicrobium sp.]PPC98310.1 MAG: flagellar motor protein MotB [Hyphomicrobium sp.]
MTKIKAAMFMTASAIAISASLPVTANADIANPKITLAQNTQSDDGNKDQQEKDGKKRRDRDGNGRERGEGRERNNPGEGRNRDGERSERKDADRGGQRGDGDSNRNEKKDAQRNDDERKKVVEPPVLENKLPRVLNAPVIDDRKNDRERDARKDENRERFGDKNRRDRDDDDRKRDARRSEDRNEDRNADRDRKRGPFNAGPVVKTGPSFSITDIKSKRRERQESGGRTVIEEPGNRVIYKQNNKFVIQKDETERVRRLAPNAKFERRDGGRNVSIVDRPNGVQIFTETDERGQLVRRYRKDRRGKEHVIIDNRRRDRSGRDLAIGVGIGAGVVAGAAIFDQLVRVPAPRVRIPRDRYILRYEGASDEDVYEALSAPPVDYVERRYTLDQVRSTPYLRDRMRRIDLDDINFEFGSSEVDPSQYRKLDRVARAMNRIIRRNPDEVFLIEGHTDAVGSTIDNLSLSDRRAESVAVILSQEYGVPFENLVTQGYGEEFLKILTQAPEVVNRRVAARRITPLIGEREVSGGPPIYNERGDGDDDRSDYSDSRDDDEDPRDGDDRDDEPYDDRGDRPRY